MTFTLPTARRSSPDTVRFIRDRGSRAVDDSAPTTTRSSSAPVSGGMGPPSRSNTRPRRSPAILEREDDLSGTGVNHYPGLAVDIASVTYSYSFEPNPYWSRLFAPAPNSNGMPSMWPTNTIRRHMRFSTVVERAEWDDDGQFWTVFTAGGQRITRRYLLTATGFLSQPHPRLQGIGRSRADHPHHRLGGRLRLRRKACRGDRHQRHGSASLSRRSPSGPTR